MESRAQAFFDAYLATLPAQKRAQINSVNSDYFCADEENASTCAQLVKQGEKRATCSMEYWYTVQNEPYPQVGHHQVVTDWHGNPVCIIAITRVERCKYKDVDEYFAAAEGEGDKSLAWWRQAHWTFFATECDAEGIEMNEDMMLVQEYFDVVYR